MNPMQPPQNPYQPYQQPQQAQGGYGPPSAQPAQAPTSKVPGIVGIGAGLATCALGMLAFLIAGFQGHSAGWEMMAIPTGLTLMTAMVGGIAGLVALVKRSIGLGIAAIGLSGFGSLLGIVGFVLGA
jgi:hypothetical protein